MAGTLGFWGLDGKGGWIKLGLKALWDCDGDWDDSATVGGVWAWREEAAGDVCHVAVVIGKKLGKKGEDLFVCKQGDGDIKCK